MATIKFRTKDITNVLYRKKKGEVIFNPAVVHWKKDLFLCSYRVYVRYADLDTRKYADDPIVNPNHPWLGGDKSQLWWQSVSGYDETRLVLLKITDKKVLLKAKLGTVPGVDYRLVKIEPNEFVMTGNTFIRDKSISVSKTDCQKGCMLMISMIVSFTPNSTLKFSKPTFLCPQFSERIEKNWSLWVTPREQLVVSYGLEPVHEVFLLEIKNQKILCPMIEKIRGPMETVFSSMRAYYNLPAHTFALSTPALPLPNGNYFAFGHMKYKYKDLQKFPRDSYLRIFTEALINAGKKFHPAFVYLMYIYEFIPTYPYDIVRISDFFLPSSTYALAFPTNLTFAPELNQYIVSYGDHDTECWLLYMTPQEVEAALHPVPRPQNVKFYFFQN